MSLAEELVKLHNDIIARDDRYGYNFEGYAFEKEPNYLSLVEEELVEIKDN